MANTTGRKYGGRKKGTPNKDTKQLREKIDQLLNDNWEQIQEDFRELKPKERLDFYIKLLDYSLPKLSKIEVEEKQIDPIDEMSEEELQAELDQLRNEEFENKTPDEINEEINKLKKLL